MRLLAPLLMSCASLIAQESVTTVGFSESRHAVHGFSPSGDVTLQAAHVQLDIARGNSRRADLVVVYDPQSGHYFWRCKPLSRPGDAVSFLTELESGAEAVFAGADAIVDFRMPGDLSYQVHRDRASSLDAAERAAIDEIRGGLSMYVTNQFNTGFREIALARAIGKEFSCPASGEPEFSQMCKPSPNIFVSIGRDGENWRLVLRNRWNEEVILGPKFEFVSTRRLLEPK